MLSSARTGTGGRSVCLRHGQHAAEAEVDRMIGEMRKQAEEEQRKEKEEEQKREENQEGLN